MLLCADVKLEIQIANQHRCSSFQNSWNTCHSLLKYYETAATALKPIMIVEIEIVVLQHEIFLYLIQHFSGWVHINSHEPGTFSIHRYRSRLTHLCSQTQSFMSVVFFWKELHECNLLASEHAWLSMRIMHQHLLQRIRVT